MVFVESFNVWSIMMKPDIYARYQAYIIALHEYEENVYSDFNSVDSTGHNVRLMEIILADLLFKETLLFNDQDLNSPITVCW